jgi:hypothetical protein
VAPSRIEWRVPAYLPYIQPALTDDALRSAERSLGHRLPKAYVAALREQNGGYLRYGFRGYAANDLWGIGPRFPSILQGSIAKRHVHDDGWTPRGADALVPFVGDGHWYLCFDVRKKETGEPQITYVDLECVRTKKVADTFAELVTTLGPDEHELIIGITTNASMARAADQLGKALRLKVTDQGEWAHGYPTLHGRAKKAGSLVQFWLTPNEVSRGFVRKDDPDYKSLVRLLPGKALRVPEHPDCKFLLKASELPAEALIDACARAGLKARRL